MFNPQLLIEQAPPDDDRFVSEFGIDLIRDAYNLQPAIDTDRVPLCLACKDTPLQIGDDTAITKRTGMINLLRNIEVWTDLLQPIDQLRRTSCKLTTLPDIAI